jgi:uncharacterized protein HemY
MSSQQLDRLAHQRGLGFPLDAANSAALSEAGVASALLQSLHSITPRNRNAVCPASLVRASELVQQKKYREAQSILQKLITANSDDPALHYALGYVYQQQEDWDEAYDSYQT